MRQSDYHFEINVNSVTDFRGARISSKECYHMLFNTICNVNCDVKYSLTVKSARKLSSSFLVHHTSYICLL